MRDGMVELYRSRAEAGSRPDVVFVTAVESPTLPHDHVRASADRLALRGGVETQDGSDRTTCRQRRRAAALGGADRQRRRPGRRRRRRLAASRRRDQARS